MTDERPVDLPAAGRLMGLDHGSTRVGVALSDGLRLAAHPHTVIPAADPDLLAEIASIATDHGVVAIVVGLPRSLDGTESASAAAARDFAERLRSAVELPVHLYDERYTTKVAEAALLAADTSRRKRKQRVDKVAAAVMLQGFLDRYRGDGRE